MKKASTFLLSILSISVFAQTTLEKTFEGIQEIDMSVSSGSAYFTKGSGETISLSLSHDIDDYDPIIEKRGDKLIIKERSGRRNYSGSSTWEFEIPNGLEVEFNTGSGDVNINALEIETQMNSGSGDFEFEDVKGEFRLNTGSGDIELKRSSGTFDVNTGSGDIDVRSSSLEIDGNTGSGDVEIRDLVALGPCMLNSGSGDVEISLGAPLDEDLSLNSGSGDAVLDFNGNKIEGDIVMTVNKKYGRIKAPFEFDTTEEIDNGSNNNARVRKSVKIGDKDVRIRIGSGSGTAEIIR